jgi:phosphoglycolate phosphatase-like HAD superfamily hydrolase
MYSAIFLDFDGVVIESANIKTQAFYDLYLPYGFDIACKAKDYHMKNQGISRFKKFLFLHRSLLQKDCLPEEQKVLSKKFSDIVFKKIFDAPLVEGVLNFLEKMKKISIPVFLLSATPDEELKCICDKKKLDSFFKGIYGSPYEKKNIGEKIITDNKFDKEKIVFIGDSVSDYEAAKDLKVKFIGRLSDNNTIFPKDIDTIKNFNELLFLF